MSKVFSAHAVSVDGYISGRDRSDDDGGFDRGLGDAPMLFDWFSDGETPSQEFRGFHLSEPSTAQVSMKYIGRPYSRELERVVAVIEPERQTVGRS